MSKTYITLNDGIDFRAIAKKMSAAGYTMNHATARNVLISSIRMLLGNVASQFGIKITEEKMKELLQSQQLHDALSDVLIEAHKELENERLR